MSEENNINGTAGTEATDNPAVPKQKTSTDTDGTKVPADPEKTVSDENQDDQGTTLLTGGENSQQLDEGESDQSESDGYQLSLSDDSILNQDQLDEFSNLAKENGLDQEQAQKFLDLQSNAIDIYKNTQEKEMKRQSAQWVEDIKKDTELGGPVFKESIENAHRAFQRFGSDEFKEHLDKSGLGNHPEVIRTFSRIGKAMANDKFINGEVSSAKKDVSLGEAMYKGFDY